jgi:UDP-2,3-diacylglucosamine hydrolase
MADNSNKAPKTYFASDFHLGAPNREQSLQRERKVVRWLASIEENAQAIYLLGDIFDFWFEYKRVVPRGFTRLLGKLADLSDKGVDIYFFTGNHDLWTSDYLEREIGITVYHQPQKVNINGTRFFMGHGDGLGPSDKGYKILKKIFTNRFCQWLFEYIHPNWGVKLAHFWSRKSRKAEETPYLGEDKEWLVLYAKRKLKEEQDIDYFVFGHRHLPLDINLNGKCRYINLGDWMNHFSYGVFDGQQMQLKYFEENPNK